MSQPVRGIIRGLDKYLVDSFFQGKSCLDPANQPDIFLPVQTSGASVSVYDTTQESVDSIVSQHSGITANVLDIFNQEVSQKFDILISSHILEKVANPEAHLINLCQNCDYLILDSRVLDSTDSSINLTPAYIQNIITSQGFQSTMPIDTIFDDFSSFFGWEPENNGEMRENNRRLFICWRDTVSSPLKPAPVSEPEPASEPAPEPASEPASE